MDEDNLLYILLVVAFALIAIGFHDFETDITNLQHQNKALTFRLDTLQRDYNAHATVEEDIMLPRLSTMARIHVEGE